MYAMLFSFKQKSQDFIVEEQLPFTLSGRGDAFFVYFEKRNLTTMDIIEFLCNEFDISRKTLGFAGLKDKDAVTRQWVSIYKSALKKLWGEKVFLNVLATKVRIISTSWHDAPVGMTTSIKNKFTIRLRANKKLSQLEKQQTWATLTALFAEWFPNFFGEQRFGIEGKNRKIGRQILEGTHHLRDKFESAFKIQAYASYLFNAYVRLRREKKLKPMDGDIVQLSSSWSFAVYKSESKAYFPIKTVPKNKNMFSSPVLGEKPVTLDAPFLTWPVIGFNLLMPPQGTESYLFEKEFFAKQDITPKILSAFQSYRIFGLRRNIWAFPQDASFRWDGDDICLVFSLASAVYASIVIDELLQKFT